MKYFLKYFIYLILSIIILGIICPFLISCDNNLLVIFGFLIIIGYLIFTIFFVKKDFIKIFNFFRSFK